MSDQLQSVSLAAIFVIGLMGSGHCVGMCGGIATALGLASESQRNWLLVIGYNLGRILSYAVAGALVATLGYWGKSFLAMGPVLRIIAGIILVLMGLYLADWWRVLVGMEKLGARLWKRIQPLGSRFLPVKTFPRALMVGAVWGWLPCGLVYTALAFAATSASPLDGAMMMLAFGLGTAPAMLAGGMFSGGLKKFLQARPVRISMAIVMMAFGVWTLLAGVNHLQHAMAPQEGDVMENHHHH